MGYAHCACRDCMEIAIPTSTNAGMCHACQSAGCEVDAECRSPDAYGGDVEDAPHSRAPHCTHCGRTSDDNVTLHISASDVECSACVHVNDECSCPGGEPCRYVTHEAPRCDAVCSDGSVCGDLAACTLSGHKGHFCAPHAAGMTVRS